MTQTIEIQQMDADLSMLLALIREGAQIILMDGETPLARIMPAEKGPSGVESSSGQTASGRVLGLHANLGTAWMSDDFDAPLPDDFWLGE